MQFTSIPFAFFLPLVFIIYWLLNKNLKIQNILLLIASYIFYGWWDLRFLFLLFFISIVNYSTGLTIQDAKTRRGRKISLIAGIIANVGVLSYFKYLNFFIGAFANLFSIFGYTLQKSTLNIILPLGISFYVFLSISYLVDIYRNKLKADKNIIEVLLTLGFFPIILAGPIQRPVTLLPQIQKKRLFNAEFAADGLRQILWGLFMKMVVADNCAVYVNDIFQNFNVYKGSTLLVGGILYTIQIYADFAGYSEIAIGVAKLFGFELMKNFGYPYFAKDITEFWRRWHMSLTSWFRDYIFLPVSYFVSGKIPNERILFLKTDLFIYITGILITWLLTGLWHGANYTFILWGFMHGLLLILYQIFKKPRKRLLLKLKIKNTNALLIGFERVFTLLLIIVTWIVFRSENRIAAFSYLHKMFSASLFSLPAVFPVTIIGLIIIFISIEWLQKDKRYTLDINQIIKNRFLRWSLYYGLIFLIFWFTGNKQQFIYSQF